ncbi:LysR substrate-binding domain-containing protein [Pseudomonas asiatica]|uniref:LysR substrate-binding domain-containing protein n=1 Tax=Pseudomonas asiatica TaxID=2219225 RepID=UPI002E7BBEC6|nr:LysR substrate-binding domain-containing protein [Pseudomonas asiatica]MEE1916356.1 LysR substrate-binding domain-containing protein [Pseudomonas asiatica]
MKIHQLRALLAVSESGSIQEASRTLHISQPSLSRGIKELEAELGVSLLLRSNRGITLTQYGEHLVIRARLIIEEVRRAKHEIETLKGAMDGSVTLGVSPVTPSTRFVDCVARFRQRHPQVRLQIEELRPSKLIEGLREGRLDLVLTSHGGKRHPEGFECVELYQEPGVLAVRKGHPHADSRALSDLRKLDWILPDRLEDSPVTSMFAELRLMPPDNLMSCSSLVMYLELDTRTDAVSFWSKRGMALGDLRDHLQVLQVVETVPSFTFSMVSREASLLTREAAALAEDIVYEFYGNRSAIGQPQANDEMLVY